MRTWNSRLDSLDLKMSSKRETKGAISNIVKELRRRWIDTGIQYNSATMNFALAEPAD
jgi:hypothetical protein